jgi:hypothetical protein
MKTTTTVVLVARLFLSGCIGEKYAAEVGYFQDGETKFKVWGDFTSLEDYRAAATARYNFYFKENHAQSWSCLKKNGKGGYASRHR